MKLTAQQIEQIEAEYKAFEAQQYCGKDKSSRQALGQFFTPPPLTIKMLEKFDSVEDKNVLDPTCGAGGLLAAAIIVGADPKKIYGIELDPLICQIARKRLAELGVPAKHIKCANALDSDAYEDFDNYVDKCDELAEIELKKKAEEEAKAEKKTEVKPKKEKPAKKVEKKVVEKAKPVVQKVDHDQKAISIQRVYGKIEVNEVKFPDVVGKKINVKTSKKADLVKMADILKQKVDDGYWLICDDDIKQGLNSQFMLNDLSYLIPEDKLLSTSLSCVKSIVDEQKFNSYDDLKKYIA